MYVLFYYRSVVYGTVVLVCPLLVFSSLFEISLTNLFKKDYLKKFDNRIQFPADQFERRKNELKLRKY